MDTLMPKVGSMINTVKAVVGVTLALCLTQTAVPVKAQSNVIGLVVQKTRSNPSNVDSLTNIQVQDFPSVFQDGIDGPWRQNKPRIDQIICDVIAWGNDHGKFPKGCTLYHQKSSVATAGAVQASFDGSSIVLTYLVSSNYVEFTTTVPGNIIGAGADPRFSLTYDLALAMHIPIESAAQGLHLQSAQATILHVSNPDSHNFTGDLGVLSGAVVKFFGGPDFANLLQNKLNNSSFDITAQMQQIIGKVNSPLAQLGQQGFTQLSMPAAPVSRALVLRALPPPALVSVRVDTEDADQTPIDKRVNRTYAQVKFFNGPPSTHPNGTAGTFTRKMLSDVVNVPIHVDIVRETRGLTQPGTKTQGGAPNSPGRPTYATSTTVLQSLDLLYDRATGRISGAMNGSLSGRMALAGSSVNTTIIVSDTGTKPRVIGLKTRPEEGLPQFHP